MKNVQSLVLSSITAFLLLVFTVASAHQPPPKQNNLVLKGPGEGVRVAFSADCNGPQDDDAYIVEPDLREISFTFRVKGSTVGGSSGEYVDSIELLNGNFAIVDVPANLGQLLEFRIENVSGQGVCQVSSTGSIVGPSGETRATYRPQFYFRPTCIPGYCP